jgi:hypothetical protein
MHGMHINKGKCIENDYLENENDKIYYACEKSKMDMKWGMMSIVLIQQDA